MRRAAGVDAHKPGRWVLIEKEQREKINDNYRVEIGPDSNNLTRHLWGLLQLLALYSQQKQEIPSESAAALLSCSTPTTCRHRCRQANPAVVASGSTRQLSLAATFHEGQVLYVPRGTWRLIKLQPARASLNSTTFECEEFHFVHLPINCFHMITCRLPCLVFVPGRIFLLR